MLVLVCGIKSVLGQKKIFLVKYRVVQFEIKKKIVLSYFVIRGSFFSVLILVWSKVKWVKLWNDTIFVHFFSTSCIVLGPSIYYLFTSSRGIPCLVSYLEVMLEYSVLPFNPIVVTYVQIYILKLSDQNGHKINFVVYYK